MGKILRSLDVQPQSFSVPNCPAKLAVSLFSVSLAPETLGVYSPGQSCVLCPGCSPFRPPVSWFSRVNESLGRRNFMSSLGLPSFGSGTHPFGPNCLSLHLMIRQRLGDIQSRCFSVTFERSDPCKPGVVMVSPI